MTGGSFLEICGPKSRSSQSVQLQKGPVQLPAFCLSPQLADRQQDSPVNLKPSEVRLAQQRSDPPGDPGDLTQHRDSEPALRGILRKSWEPSGTDVASCQERNGGGCGQTSAGERTERQALPVPPCRQRRSPPGGEGDSQPAAPWRQRARARRETIACPPGRTWEELDAPQDRRDKPPDQLVPSAEPKRAAQ